MVLSLRTVLGNLVVSLLCCKLALAQSIAITQVSPTPVCAGSAVTISYQHSFSGTGTYTLYLYNATNSTVAAKGPTVLNWVPGSYSDNLSIPANLPTGTYTVGITRVSNTNSTYNSPRSPGFTVNAAPAAPMVTNLAYCQGTTDVAPLTATGQGLKWYTASAGGTPSATAPTPPTSTPGTTDYYVSQTINGCEGPRATLTVTINAPPNAPATTNVSYCQGAAAQPLTAAGQGLSWYTAALGGTPLPSITPATSTTGATTYFVSQTDNNSCESNRSLLTVIINPIPPAPSVANTAVVYCQNTSAQPLQATATSDNTLNWYNSQGSLLGSTAPTPQTINPGTTFYQVSQRSASGCEGPRARIAVTINGAPAAPATSPADACQGGATVSLVNSVTPTSGNSLHWYTSPTSASLAAAPFVTTTQTGSQVFYVSQISTNSCESSRAVITYTVNPVPNPPSVVSPVTYCQNAVAQPLQATPLPGGTLNFYTVSSGGTSTTSLTPSTQSSNLFYVSQTVNGCESSSRASIRVLVTTQPSPPAVTTPVVYCQFATASPLSATAATNNTLIWYALNGQPQGSALTPSTTVTGVASYSVSQREPAVGCVSQPALITITVNAKPTAPATSALNACLNTTAPSLLSSVTATGTLTWYTASTGGIGTPVAPVLSTTTVGVTTYYVSQTNAEGCESDRAAIAYTVNAPPTTPILSASPTTTLSCPQASLTLTAGSGSTGGLSYRFNGPGILSQQGNQALINAPGTYSVSAATTAGCSSEVATIVISQDNTSPVIITNQPPSVSSVTAGASVRVPISVSGSVSGYQWYKDQLINPVAGQNSATLSITSAQLSDAGSYSLVVVGACNSVTSTAFNLSVSPPLADLTPLLYARPTTANGTTSITVVVDVYELSSVTNSGAFSVKVSKDPKVSLILNRQTKTVGGKPVQNDAWTLSGPVGGYYTLTASQPVVAGGMLSFGLEGTLTPGSTTGVLTISSTVQPLDFTESANDNNTDADKIEYFQQ